MKIIQLTLLLFLSNFLLAQNNETQYLSGTGADKTVNWKFFCSAGMNSGKWTTIAVPSCWELQGFGAYNYGHDKYENRINETGTYRYKFNVPAGWQNKQVNIVFDGVMTDAEVKINGKLAGPIHQGAFYQFKYDISKLLKPGKENQLEVLVNKHSGNWSINEAERQADFWIFGGIFRPVYLEAKPKENIARVAVDARANGDFQANVYISGFKNAVEVIAEIQTLSGKTESKFETAVNAPVCNVSGKMASPKTWNPEFPNRYKAVFKLLDKNGALINQYSELIGFRTVEVRESDGIYINGVRIKMQGVCRHTFNPKYGRTSSKALSIEAVNLMKDMNMNAVRMSHYPPDKHFLDVCDSLGLVVLDELTAWQKPSYDDVVGRKLMEEMIAHDVNHPSIILWDNGNEGGENNNLNDDFAELDIQKRKVLHPWQDYDLTNTLHYSDYNSLALDGFSKRKIFFPTEFLHGLYDGGLGAGLDDYWQMMWNNPLAAGGFLWVFADEAVERTDRNRELDSDGNHAPDGILGPYNEKEGSFYTIKEIWSPVQFEKRYISPEFNGSFRIENRYFYTNLNKCTFDAEWVSFSSPDKNRTEEVNSRENLKIDLAPGQKGMIQLKLPENWQKFDALRIKATDQYGRVLNTWSWPVKYPEAKIKELLTETSGEKPTIQETEKELIVKTNKLNFTFSKTDGTIQQIKNGDRLIPLSNGPVFVAGEKKVKQSTHRFEDNVLVIETVFENNDMLKWTVFGNGLIDLDVNYEPNNNCLFAGVTFDYPEKNVVGIKWLGNGPYRVYKNRMKGVEFGLWEKAYNNTITGESGFKYPEFKGYHSEVYWAKIEGKDSPDFKVYIHSKDIFLRMLTPADPKAPARTKIEYPKGDISFLNGINAIGTKFTDASSSGPQSNPYQFNSAKIHGGKLNMKITFDFR
ncbi:beta-galactosidase [Aquipluma nitroreducens]|uniref:beta-galactosidase n=1 Tax=Aquipluma nitroreducens TaxID=2010828 RepID=A0A5K7SFF1_9BACT|nr:glycoside hydrolase family 2 TIM barrel-domain containing protein [Aquipluma nitroreducens]BBE20330.1 beta-galactosidase [Aquipluma nitroreducens]